MHPIAYLFDMVLGICNFFMMAWLILRLLIDFNILNRYSHIVNAVYALLERLLKPILEFFRRYVPNVLGFDFSPVIVLILIQFLRYTLRYYFMFHR